MSRYSNGVDPSKVLKTGDTMTGALNLPTDGLVVGTNELVTSGGKVGIGISPGYKLDVYGTINSQTDDIKMAHAGAGDVGFSAIGAGGARGLSFNTYNGGIVYGQMVIDPTGKVGIGTASPALPLDVIGTIKASGLQLPKVASATLRNSNDAEVIDTTAFAYTLLKKTTLTNGITGSARVSYDAYTNGGGSSGHSKVYINGAPFGAEQLLTGSYATYTEDETINLAAGATIEIWIKRDAGASSSYCKNFRLLYDDAPTVAVVSVNTL